MALNLPEPTHWAIPLFVVFVLAELIYGWRNGHVRYEGKDTFTSIFMGVGSLVAGALSAAFVITLAYWVWQNFRIFDFGYSWLVFLLAFVLDDFVFYWTHRFGHRMRWMWAAHVIHHSSQHYNLSTALRQTWTGQLTPGIFFRWPIFLLGIEPAIVFFCAGLNLVYQFWIHTEAIDKCPKWFEAVMNTPSHHRVHHSSNPRYLDANYAGVFIIWDRMFGTFIPEISEDPCVYGLVANIETYNPLRVATHEWASIFQDIRSADSWRDRLLYLLAPPGWTPDGSRMTSEMIKEAWIEKMMRAPSE